MALLKMLTFTLPCVTNFFKVTLEDNGFDADAYIDPIQAFANFKPNFYDLCIIDTRMPRLNGFEFFENIKKKP